MGTLAPKDNELSFNANILIKLEDGVFVAHCLELDIVAVGSTLEEAQKTCAELICAQLEYAFVHDNLDNLFHPAPKEVWGEFYRCKAADESSYRVNSMLDGVSGYGNGGHEAIMPPWLTARTCVKDSLCHA